MAITYTNVDPQTYNWTTGSSGSWNNYDIVTNEAGSGIAKGDIAEIVIGWTDLNGADNVGVRTDGSGLSRVVMPHEAEGAGNSCVTMFVTVHATTGLIECFTDDHTETTYYLIGYWRGVTFTETRTAMTLSTGGAWTNYDIFTTHGYPKGQVYQIALRNTSGSAAITMGLRIDGSGLNRYVAVHECEPGAAGSGTFYTQIVKSSVADGIIEYYVTSATRYAYILGYFDNTLDFSEAWTQHNFTAAAGTWESFDITGALGADGDVAYFYVGHQNRTAESQIGVREGGTALNRYIDVHEAETNGYDGYGVCVETSSTGTVELTEEKSNTDDYFWFAGYFPNTAVTPAAGQPYSSRVQNVYGMRTLGGW